MMNVVSANCEKTFNLYTLFRYNYKVLNEPEGKP